MNRHPGGEAQTLYLLENIEWKKEMKALDLGAGEGDTVRILKSFGLEAHGVDLFPRGSDVEIGDFLHLQYSSDSIEQTGFTILRQEDQTLLWREYYLEAIWNDSFCCEEYKILQKEYKGKKLRYTMVVGRKE